MVTETLKKKADTEIATIEEPVAEVRLSATEKFLASLSDAKKQTKRLEVISQVVEPEDASFEANVCRIAVNTFVKSNGFRRIYFGTGNAEVCFEKKTDEDGKIKKSMVSWMVKTNSETCQVKARGDGSITMTRGFSKECPVGRFDET